MFHKALDLQYGEGTVLKLVFADGKVMQYDVAALFAAYPQLRALEDRELFLSGELVGAYGIVWNEELDLEAETVYEEGECVASVDPSGAYRAGVYVRELRKLKGLTQIELAERCGLDQADISKLERGLGNPSLATLERIAKALDSQLQVRIV